MEHVKDITVTTRGQLTLPVKVRRAMKLGSKRKVRLSMTDGGIVTLRSLPDAMSLYGIFKGRGDYDPREKQKAAAAMGRHAARKP